MKKGAVQYNEENIQFLIFHQVSFFSPFLWIKIEEMSNLIEYTANNIPYNITGHNYFLQTMSKGLNYELLIWILNHFRKSNYAVNINFPALEKYSLLFLFYEYSVFFLFFFFLWAVVNYSRIILLIRIYVNVNGLRNVLSRMFLLRDVKYLFFMERSGF
jgi:hypothetical protein